MLALVLLSGVVQQDVRYASGELELAATLVAPAQAQHLPGVVVIHGSGESDRSNPWTAAYAEALAEQGIVVLHTDKRGCGQSGGSWLEADFDDLAKDASAGLAFLRDRPEVDPKRMGVIAFSQGGYVAPLVAASDPACRFAAVVSGGVRPLLDQMVDEIVLEAVSEKSPLTAEEEALVRKVYADGLRAARGELDWEVAQKSIADARKRSVRVEHALRTIPTEKDHPGVGWLARVGNADPLPAWSKVECPTVFVFGGRDDRLRVQATLDGLLSLPEEKRPEVLVFGQNGHALFRADLVAFLARWMTDGGAR